MFVARTSVAGSRTEGLAAAVGMGVGGLVFATVVLLGFQALLIGVPWLFLTLKVLGGVYLIYMTVGIIRGARAPLAVTQTSDAGGSGAQRAFRRGLFTQLSNPKTAVVYGSIFAALLPRDLPHGVAYMLPGLVFLIEAGWYAIVALLLSSVTPRQTYLNWKTAIDRIAGGVLGLLGIKLLASVHAGR